MQNLGALAHLLADSLIEARNLLELVPPSTGVDHYLHDTFPTAMSGLYKLTDEITVLRLRELRRKIDDARR